MELLNVANLDDWLALALALGLVLQSFMEFVKNGFLKSVQKQQKWSDDQYRNIVSVIALIAAVLLSFFAAPGTDVLAAAGMTTAPFIGVLLTAAMIWGGNAWIHQGYDILKNIGQFVMLVSHNKRLDTRQRTPQLSAVEGYDSQPAGYGRPPRE